MRGSAQELDRFYSNGFKFICFSCANIFSRQVLYWWTKLSAMEISGLRNVRQRRTKMRHGPENVARILPFHLDIISYLTIGILFSYSSTRRCIIIAIIKRRARVYIPVTSTVHYAATAAITIILLAVSSVLFRRRRRRQTRSTFTLPKKKKNSTIRPWPWCRYNIHHARIW
jgi:hypothetical protein